MIDKLIVEAPINPLSLGNVSLNILKSLYKKKVDVLYLPIGQPDIGVYKLTDDFKNWLQNSTNRFFKEFRREIPSLKIWHISQSWHFPSDIKYLATFHETDSCTQEELNIVKNTNKTFFCGNYSSNIFKDLGAKNVDSYNLGFDSDSFTKTDKTYFNDGRIQWGLFAKLEHRKLTLKTLSLWAKKYGKRQGEFYQPGEQKHFLNCQIVNPFYDIKIQQNQIAQALNGQNYTNIQFFNFLDRESWNDMLNATNIDLTGLSGGESWNLIPFNISCLSKWSIVLNCSGMKSWATENNSVLVSPSGKMIAVDNIHFHANSPFNVGNFYCYSDDDVLEAMKIAESKAKTPNIEGEKLTTEFTYDKTVDYILSQIEKDLNK